MEIYRVKKYIIEEFEVEALTRKEAVEKAEVVYDPDVVTVTRITVVKEDK